MGSNPAGRTKTKSPGNSLGFSCARTLSKRWRVRVPHQDRFCIGSPLGPQCTVDASGYDGGGRRTGRRPPGADPARRRDTTVCDGPGEVTSDAAAYDGAMQRADSAGA